MIDITEMKPVIDTINAILSGGGIAEVKKEKWKSGEKITVVEQTRAVKAVYPEEK